MMETDAQNRACLTGPSSVGSLRDAHFADQACGEYDHVRSCVMRKDEGELGHCVRLWSRMVILCAVIIAVPVILWTLTTLVQNQPKLSTLLATASINTPGHTTIAEPTQRRSTPRQMKYADLREVDAPERVAPEEPLVVDDPSDPSRSVPIVPQKADKSSASSATSLAEGFHGMHSPLTANDGAAADRADGAASMQPAPATERKAVSGSAPLPGPIQLPRPRPHAAGTVRTADPTLSRVPMPRPRPAVGGGSGAR